MAVYLKPDSVVSFKIGNETRKINVKIIPDTATAPKYIAEWIQKGDKVKPCKKLNDGTGKPKGICIHNTDFIKTSSETNPAEQYARATHPNGNMSGAVVHYYIYKNEIWQLLSDNERGWHAGDGSSRKPSQRTGEKIGGNVDCISIEIIQSAKDGETEKTGALLTAYLLNKHGLKPETDIYTHKYFSGKNCPKILLPRFDSFKADVKNFYNQLQKSDSDAEIKKSISTIKKELSKIEGLLNG